MRKVVFIFCFFFLLKATEAQQHLVDSIAKELQQPMADSSRSMSMMRLAIDYEVVDTAKAYNAYRDAITFAREKKLYYQLGRIYQNQSFLYSSATRYDDCRSSLDTAVLYYQKSDHPNAKLWEGNALGDLKCISVFEQLGMTDKLVIRYCNLSGVFGDLEEYKKQEEYAVKAVNTAKKTMGKMNLFISYYMLSNSLTRQEKNNEAKQFIDSARIYKDENANVDILFSYYLIAAQVFRKLNNFDSAIYYFQKSYDVSEKNNYGYGKAESLLQLGGVSIQQKKYSDAETFLLKGLKQAEDIGYVNMLDDGYKYLSDVYAMTGRYKQAYESFQKYKELNDSTVAMTSKQYATELEKKYESEKKDKQIKLQQAAIKQKNTLNYVLIGSAAALLIISLLGFRNYKHKQTLQQRRINELETEKQLMATEAVLKGEEQERTRLAKDLHDGLGGMLSGIKYSFNHMKGNLVMTPENAQAFERSMDMLDSSIKEMRRVAHNMMPEALVKFGLDTALKDFCNDISNSGALNVTYQSVGLESAAIEQTTAITIYRIVQELLNNTIKHATAETAIVQLSKSGDQISVTVEDDGKGFDASVLQASRGIGWTNIQNRVEFLKGKLDVNTAPGKGTSVLIELTTV